MCIHYNILIQRGKNMSKLSCSVCDCASNSSGCCCRPNINVSGSSATDCCGTNCSSYMPRGQASNSCGCNFTTPNENLEISCNASNCMYNSHCQCTSNDVNIEFDGTKSLCKTFKAK